MINEGITRAFSKGKAFIPFVTAGDPDLETTEKIIYAMEEAGADLIELGIPFSDPTAEGPIIQDANIRALKNQITTDDVFDLVSRVRKKSQIPLAFMTYANVVFHYGSDQFIQKMADRDMCALILPDVPYEEKDEFDSICRKYNVPLISFIAPTSHDRIRKVAKDADGFIYCISSLGVTGMRSVITTDIGAMVRLLKENTDVPCAVGFGISTPEQASDMASKSDGAIVGSAIVKIIAEHGRASVPYVKEFVQKMADAVHAVK